MAQPYLVIRRTPKAEPVVSVIAADFELVASKKQKWRTRHAIKSENSQFEVKKCPS